MIFSHAFWLSRLCFYKLTFVVIIILIVSETCHIQPFVFAALNMYFRMISS